MTNKNIVIAPASLMPEKEELYIHHLKKMAYINASREKIPLTNMYNTRSFYFKANECMLIHGGNYAIIRLDIYRFKTINELSGRKEGDKLLKYIAQCLLEYESNRIVVGHLRADIFVMCVPFHSKEELVIIVEDIKNKIQSYTISCKVLPFFGICMSNGDMEASLMCDYANLAMQGIKGKVYSYYAFYHPSMMSELLYEKMIQNEVDDSLQNHYIKPYIQPKVDMRTHKIIGGEALIRWNHPVRGILYPDQFISVLEKSGHIIETDIYIWDCIFQTIRKWMDDGIEVVPVSVNVSREHVYQKNFVEILCKMVEKYEVRPEYVPLELTESVFTDESDKLYEKINILQKKGFQFLVDDFGSGYSSLNMLKDEPVDEVKIDRNFLRDISDTRSQIVIRNVIQMISELGMDMIVEGVEDQEQAQLLLSYGCQKAQGFYYYKPMPIEEFESLLKRQMEDKT